MRNGGTALGPAATIYEECSSLRMNFVIVQFFHCPREANVAADCLARHLEESMSIAWHEEPPDFLVSLLSNDVSILSIK